MSRNKFENFGHTTFAKGTLIFKGYKFLLLIVENPFLLNHEKKLQPLEKSIHDK
jgi:hypothetical protein